jgi:hypothetical protein
MYGLNMRKTASGEDGMMKRAFFAVALALVVLQFAPVQAAGPYDGNWSGAIDGTGVHCLGGTLTMHITNNAISGVIGLSAGSIGIHGSVAADGSVNAAYNNTSTGGSSTLTGKISGSDFAGSLDSKFPSLSITCVRNASAKRS